MKNPDYTVILFYTFIHIENPKGFMEKQRSLCTRLNLKGRMLIAEEGINATFEGKTPDIQAYMDAVHENPLFSHLVFKQSEGNGKAFQKLKIKVRNEIVTLGAGTFDVPNETAKELTADEFHALYEKREDFVVLDLRNDFEVAVGYFDKTFDPKLRNFRDLPKKLAELENLKKKKIITVCTGGIRCEKATCLMKREGFENIYQLKDGIHTYMAKYPGENFKGSLFVFDDRMLTDVVEIPHKEIVGKCAYCGVVSENFYNDDSYRPSRKVIACTPCYLAHVNQLREAVGAKI